MSRLMGLLLGAGASVEAGMPLAWDLTGEIKNWLTPDKLRELNRGWRLQGGGYSDPVIDELADLLERPGLHYEAILGHLETQFRRQRTALQEYHGLYSWMVELVSILLVYRQVNNGAFFERHLPLYDGLGALARGTTPLWVFSLNHDLIIEAMAARLELPLYCGFGPKTVSLPRRDSRGQKVGELRAEVITQHDLEHGCMYFPNPLRPGICLLKVHGSLDTFTFNDGKDVLRLLPQAPGSAGTIDALRAANSDLFYPHPGALGGRAKGVNEIIYADDAGEMQFLRRSLLAGAYKFDARANQTLPKSLLKHFRQNMNFVTELVCIGYSFGDVHINLAIRDWLEFSADRRLEIVAPGIEEIPRDFLHLARQVSLTNSGCTDYLDARAGIERTETEQLEKKIGTITRKLGVVRSRQAMSSFLAADRERVGQALRAELEAVPVRDGAPDLAALGDPATVGRQWAAEIRGSHDETLARILEHLAKVGER
jgi:hypothetical protein